MMRRGRAPTCTPRSCAVPAPSETRSTARPSDSAQLSPSPPHTPHSSTSPACALGRASYAPPPRTRHFPAHYLRAPAQPAQRLREQTRDGRTGRRGRRAPARSSQLAVHEWGQAWVLTSRAKPTLGLQATPHARTAGPGSRHAACTARQALGSAAVAYPIPHILGPPHARAWQQRPCASTAPLTQQAPSASASRARPPHTPQASTRLRARARWAACPTRSCARRLVHTLERPAVARSLLCSPHARKTAGLMRRSSSP